MSATGRGAIRKANDGYATPGWCVDRLLERVDLPGGHWLEPCAGQGNIIEVVNRRRQDVHWSAVEIRPQHEARLARLDLRACRIGDFLALEPAAMAFFPRYDVVITNPPYFFARQFIERCRPIARIVAMLLRVNFLASEERHEWWLRHGMPDMYVLPNRPDFTGGGGDATEYAWLVFEEGVRQFGRFQVLALTPEHERKREKARLRVIK